ncbi:MAG: crossover junction endodeoxyribonuclease RuvC [bacterium]|nr:crossover junction endodeoxyribonuclease RuvC [bacterium]
MRIIGIDAGLRCTGYAIIEDGKLIKSGTCSTANNLPIPERLKKLYEEMKLVMQKESPDIAVYETVFYKQNPKTLCTLAQVLGVLLLAAKESGIKVKEYTPAEIKQAITGSGRASKYQIHGMVERLLGEKIPSKQDIGDAVACALCYSLRNEEK